VCVSLLMRRRLRSTLFPYTTLFRSNATVSVDPDRLFGRHLAVLGNTGSGKSCSVAGLIRWSLEAAKKKRGASPNARFIVLDPNRSEEHTSELQSRENIVCRLLLDKK